MTQPAPARLTVLLAPAAPVAVVIRRGPSRWAQLTRWETDTDRFEPGQWLHGRVYEEQPDLSPDGSLFVYYATRHRQERFRGTDKSYGWTGWTAVSRPPYFTALSLWPQPYCWLGGGMFLGPRHVLLNQEPYYGAPLPGREPPPDFRADTDPNAWGQPDWYVPYRRMERDGWVPLPRGGPKPTWTPFQRAPRPEVWERPHPSGRTTLRRTTDTVLSRGGGTRLRESFRLVLAGGREVPVPGATWADWDHAGRLVFARAGKLFAGAVGDGRLAERELFDLNPFAPTQLPPPEWARRW